MTAVPEDPRRTGGAQSAATRVARNAALRGVAELVGKFSTLALMVVLARLEGPIGLGVFVFALAWSELASTPIDMGYDRHFQRLIARDPSRLGSVLFNVLALKARRTVPVVAASWLIVWVAGYDADTRAAVALLTVTYLLETVRYTVFAVFTAHERADLVGLVLVCQRLVSGGVGLLVLLLGAGVVAVAGAYVLAAAVGLVLAVALLARHVGLPRLALPRGPRAELERHSLPFAAQEMLSAGMARLDVVLLSVFASQAVVGLYGAAYRLLEASLIVSTSLLGAFSAMFTYLDEHSEPSIRSVFGRAVKLSVVLLTPCAVPLAVLPGPILELFFGVGFEAGADALRLLAPTVIILGNVMLTGSLIASRLSPKLLVRCFALAFTVNVVGNLAFVPPLGATGAALAMLLCELVLGVVMLRIAVRAVGAPPLVATVGAAAAGGAAMALVLALLDGPVLVGLAAGALAYVAIFVLVERRLAPEDLRMVGALVRDRLPGRRGAGVREAV